jgi:hypothetical protein
MVDGWNPHGAPATSRNPRRGEVTPITVAARIRRGADDETGLVPRWIISGLAVDDAGQTQGLRPPGPVSW